MPSPVLLLALVVVGTSVGVSMRVMDVLIGFVVVTMTAIDLVVLTTELVALLAALPAWGPPVCAVARMCCRAYV